MNVKLKTMQAFVGKVCTILTVGVNKRNFDDPQFSDFFTGIVESIDEIGIFTKHHLTGCKSFYNWEYIVGILEEQVIEQSNPEYDNILSEIKKKERNLPVQQGNLVQTDTGFVNPDLMADLAKQAQEVQKRMLQKGSITS